MSFSIKEIKSNTLGSLFSKSRKDVGLSLKDIVQKTGIIEKYLEYIEADDFYKFPSATYTRGVLSRYAEALNLDVGDILNKWKQEYKDYSDKPKIEPKRHKSSKHLNIKTLAVVLILLLILTYIGVSIKTAITPPLIEILHPPQEFITQQASLVIRGQTKKNADVYINNQFIGTTDDTGEFTQKIELLQGLNTIEISAKKKYSRMQRVYHKVVLEKSIIND